MERVTVIAFILVSLGLGFVAGFGAATQMPVLQAEYCAYIDTERVCMRGTPEQIRNIINYGTP